jgi:hypothetical protein
MRGSDAVWLTPLNAARPDLDDGSALRLSLALDAREPLGLLMPVDCVPAQPLASFVAVLRREVALRRDADARSDALLVKR